MKKDDEKRQQVNMDLNEKKIQETSTSTPTSTSITTITEQKASNSDHFINTSTLTSLTTIKIKLHNNWKRTKYSSLGAIRLFEIGTQNEVDLSTFSTQVWSGNSLLPKSSEVAHTVSSLFTKGRNRQYKDWKFTIDSGTQLILTGHITGTKYLLLLFILYYKLIM